MQVVDVTDLPRKIRVWRASGGTSWAAIACGVLAITLLVVAGSLTTLKRVPPAYGDIGAGYRLAQAFGGVPSAGLIDAVPESAFGYPLVLAVLAWVTPGTMSAMRCFAETSNGCHAGGLPFVIGVQIVVAVVSIGLIYRLASALSGNPVIGVVTVALYLLATRPGSLAGQLRFGVWYLFFMLLYLVAIEDIAQRQSRRRQFYGAVAGGVALGLGILFQPLAILLVPVTAASLYAMPRAAVADGTSARAGWSAALFAGAAIMTSAGVLWVAVANTYDATALARRFLASYPNGAFADRARLIAQR